MGIFSFVVVILSSCKKEDKMNELSNNVLSKPKSGGTSAVPSYNNWDEFYNYYFPILNGDTVLENSIQSTKSFVSMKSLFDEYLQAESEIVNFYDTLTDADIRVLGIDTTRIEHSSEFTRNAEAINVITDKDKTSWADIDIFDIHLGALTNDKGLMLVGKTLYQFGWDFIKFMTFNSSANFNEIVAANSTDATNKITLTGFRTKSGHNAGKWSNVWSDACKDETDKKRFRLLGYVDFIKHPHHDSQFANWWQLHMTTKILRKRLFGLWYDRFKRTNITNQTSNITTTYFDNFSFSWQNPVIGDIYPSGVDYDPNLVKYTEDEWINHEIVKTTSGMANGDKNILTIDQNIIFYSGTFKHSAVNQLGTYFSLTCFCETKQ